MRSPLIGCAKRLALRLASARLGAVAARNASAAFAHFLGSTKKSINFQWLGGFLPDLSTSHPQCSPSSLWTNPVLDGAWPQQRRPAGNRRLCLFFKQRDGLPLESIAYENSQAPFHKPSTVLSRCFVESGVQRCAGAPKQVQMPWQALLRHVRDAPQPARSVVAQNLSRACFALSDQRVSHLVRRLSTIDPQHCPCRLWKAAASPAMTRCAAETGALRPLPRARPRVRVAPVFSEQCRSAQQGIMATRLKACRLAVWGFVIR